jgi:hypothetical protein
MPAVTPTIPLKIILLALGVFLTSLRGRVGSAASSIVAAIVAI